MNRMRRMIVGAAVAGSLLTGGVIGAALAGPLAASAATPSSTAAAAASPSASSGKFVPNEDPAHEAGESAAREAKAQNVNLPVSPTSITDPQTITISGVDFRVKGGPVGDDWAVVGQTMATVDQARSNLIFAEVLIGPVLLIVVFLGALAIGRRVASPIEQARQRQMDFTANASHELRTPLAVIQAQTSLALAQPRNADWYQHAFAQVNLE